MDEVNVVWRHARRLIEKNEFTIYDRIKNNQFKRAVGASDQDIKDALLDLKVTDFINRVDPDTERRGSVICSVAYKHRYWTGIDLFVRLSLVENKNVVVISFHESKGDDC